LRILIADENRLEADGLRKALERADDIEVVGVTHEGRQMCGLIERRRPDVVVLDLDMNEADADWLDVVNREHPEVKLVVLSSSTSPRDVRSALSRGADAFILRTVNPADVPSAMRQLYDGTVITAVEAADAPEDVLHSRGLTRREITMLKALGRGLSNKAISQELWVSEHTVKFHLGNLYRKLGVANRLAAASFAHARGLSAA
jgi:DNA-binding NarL/FixJ family response regulator